MVIVNVIRNDAVLCKQLEKTAIKWHQLDELRLWALRAHPRTEGLN